jgi:hypothetical protein
MQYVRERAKVVVQSHRAAMRKFVFQKTGEMLTAIKTIESDLFDTASNNVVVKRAQSRVCEIYRLRGWHEH